MRPLEEACPDENQLVAYLAGVCGAEVRARIRAHLDACEPCRDLAASLSLPHAELESLFRVLGSQLDVSLSGALR